MRGPLKRAACGVELPMREWVEVAVWVAPLKRRFSFLIRFLAVVLEGSAGERSWRGGSLVSVCM